MVQIETFDSSSANLNDIFTNGYWEDLKAFDDGDGEFDWGYLENEQPLDVDCAPLFGLNPYDFLHGYCDVFAEELEAAYGYRVESVYENERLVHAYCVAENESGPLYLDARGACGSWSLMMQDFYDSGLFANEEASHFTIVNESALARNHQIPKEDEEKIRSAAKFLIDELGFWDPKRIEFKRPETEAELER